MTELLEALRSLLVLVIALLAAPPEAPAPSATPTPTPTPIVMPAVATPDPNRPAYRRADWPHWRDADGDCQNTRHEVLIAESLIAPEFTNARSCTVSVGRWIGLYTGNEVTSARRLDIDHLVPLANAHDSGGWAWPRDKKQRYANDLSYADHLIAVTASANRSKGRKAPHQWKPVAQESWCRYAQAWIDIKVRWELTATAEEISALQAMLATCPRS